MKAKQSVLYGVTLINYMSSFSSWRVIYISKHYSPTTVTQGWGQAHLPFEKCAFDSPISDWITKSQNTVWKWILGLTHRKQDHLVCCQCTEVFLWSLFKGKFLLSSNIGIILLDCALSLPICGGYIQSKATKNYIQQASKTFAKHDHSAEVM